MKKDTSKTVLAMALTATIAVLALFGATFVLLQIKFKEPISISISDWLQMAVPIVGGAIVIVFAFLGVNRLKDYDERQDKLAKELKEDLNTRIDSSLKLVEPRLNDVYSDWEKKSQEKLSKYNETFNQYEEKLNSVDTRLARFDAIFGSAERIIDITDAIGNVAEAHDYISKLESDADIDDLQRTKIISTLVERVKTGDIIGDSNDYHNMAAQLARQNYYDYASDVTQKGLGFFEDDIDLLGDFTYYSHKASRIDDVNVMLNKIDQIDKNTWNWRLFTFCIDVMNDHKATADNQEKTLYYVAEYKRVLPNEERAFMAEYETYKKYGDLDKAEAALSTAETQLAMTAQCSLALSQIYHMQGEYDKAIYSANRAIIGQAETQPSSNTGAAYAHRALARDAKINKCLLDGSTPSEQIDEIQQAIDDYNMAFACGYSHANLAIRIKILKSLIPLELRQDANNTDVEERLDKIEHIVSAIIMSIKDNGDE